MEVNIFDLMTLFDNFNEKNDAIHGQFYEFFCDKFMEKVYLIVYPKVNTIFLTIKSAYTTLLSCEFKFCDMIRVDLHHKVVLIFSGFDKHTEFVKCSLSLRESLNIYIASNFSTSGN